MRGDKENGFGIQTEIAVGCGEKDITGIEIAYSGQSTSSDNKKN